MITEHPLTRLFGGSRAAVLEVLLTINDELTVRKIAGLAEISPTSASEALQTLTRMRVLERREIGASHLYRLAPGNMAVPQLRMIMTNAQSIDRDFGEILTETLENVPVLAAVLYGSVARGDDSLDSDVDVLVVIDNDDEQLTSIIAEAEERLSRYIGRPVHMIATNWPSATEQRRPFWREVRRDGRALAGTRVRELIDG